MTLAHENHEHKPKTHKKDSNRVSTEEINKCMSTLLAAVSSDLSENEFFKTPKDLQDFVGHIIKSSTTKTKATTALSEILREVARAQKVNTTNFPKGLIKKMKKAVRADYGKSHTKLSHFLEKNPKKLFTAKTAWNNTATGDILVAGRLLVALKAGTMESSKTSLKKDFKKHFPKVGDLYAISSDLKKFMTENSKKLDALEKNGNALKNFKYDEMIDLLNSGKLEESLKHASSNIIEKGDRFVSLYFLESLAGLGVDEAIKELDHVITELKKEHTEVEVYMQNTFFKEYYNLYGRKHYIGGSPKDETKKSVKTKEKPKKEKPKKKEAKKEPKKEKTVKEEPKKEKPKKEEPKKETPTTNTIEAGPIWNQQDANQKCPLTCKTALEWNGQWVTTEQGKMSVCGTKPVKKGAPPPFDVKAGPIWNQQDATQKCPTVIAKALKWNGAWWTTVPGAMSVCVCEINPEPYA